MSCGMSCGMSERCFEGPLCEDHVSTISGLCENLSKPIKTYLVFRGSAFGASGFEYLL